MIHYSATSTGSLASAAGLPGSVPVGSSVAERPGHARRGRLVATVGARAADRPVANSTAAAARPRPRGTGRADPGTRHPAVGPVGIWDGMGCTTASRALRASYRRAGPCPGSGPPVRPLSQFVRLGSQRRALTRLRTVRPSCGTSRLVGAGLLPEQFSGPLTVLPARNGAVATGVVDQVDRTRDLRADDRRPGRWCPRPGAGRAPCCRPRKTPAAPAALTGPLMVVSGRDQRGARPDGDRAVHRGTGQAGEPGDGQRAVVPAGAGSGRPARRRPTPRRPARRAAAGSGPAPAGPAGRRSRRRP